MGNIMISVDDEKEKEIRKYAQEVYGGKKGSLSEFISQAVTNYILSIKKEYERKAAHKRLIERMKKGLDIGYTGYKTRSELYEHRLKDSAGQ
ncbi:MAG TPA: ribbon-helix-helix domain-containing protein [Candidatus Nanoarchaeia archaeon]|nr:ribbon-helix-helix domain-containing protein [Candidatus Nanoarchaeia archaeon]